MSKHRSHEAKSRQPPYGEASAPTLAEPEGLAHIALGRVDPRDGRIDRRGLRAGVPFRTFEAEAFVIPTGRWPPPSWGGTRTSSAPSAAITTRSVPATKWTRPPASPRISRSKTARVPCAVTRQHIPRTPPITATASWSASSSTSSKSPQRWDVVGVQVSGRGGEQLHQAVGGPAGRNNPHQPRQPVGQPRPRENLHYRPKGVAAEALGHADPRVRQRLHAQDRGHGWPQRWQAECRSRGTEGGDGSFQIAAPGPALAALPTPCARRTAMGRRDCTTASFSRRTTAAAVDQRFSGLQHRSGSGPLPPPNAGLHWVGDLAVKCQCEVQSEIGEATWELVKGGGVSNAAWTWPSGAATLAVSGADMQQFHPSAAHAPPWPRQPRGLFLQRGPSTAAVDRRQRDPFRCRHYLRFHYVSWKLGTHRPTVADLCARGHRGVRRQLAHQPLAGPPQLVLHRPALLPARHTRITDFKRAYSRTWPTRPHGTFRRCEHERGGPAACAGQPHNPGKDQFLVLGDNSPQSKDSRLWESSVTLPHAARCGSIGSTANC